MSEQNILVSIIMPFFDHRGQFELSVKSFLKQSLARGWFEILIPHNPEIADFTEFDHIIKRPSIRLIPTSSFNESELYNVGAETARGKYLYLTESHCTAEPTCVEEAIQAAVDQNCDCIYSHSTGISSNKIGEMEQVLFEQDMDRWWKGTDQAKVTLRGFLIERNAWLEAGGFQSEYGHLSEIMLGRKLLNAGKKFGYADRSIVSHYNNVDLDHLSNELIAYGFDECRSNHLAPPVEEKFLSEEWQWYQHDLEAISPILRAHQKRVSKLKWILRLSPKSARWFMASFREFCETSIRIGRLQYLMEMPAAKIESKPQSIAA